MLTGVLYSYMDHILVLTGVLYSYMNHVLVVTSLQSFESGQALFLVFSYFHVISSAFLSTVFSLRSSVCFKFPISK